MGWGGLGGRSSPQVLVILILQRQINDRGTPPPPCLKYYFSCLLECVNFMYNFSRKLKLHLAYLPNFFPFEPEY